MLDLLPMLQLPLTAKIHHLFRAPQLMKEVEAQATPTIGPPTIFEDGQSLT